VTIQVKVSKGVKEEPEPVNVAPSFCLPAFLVFVLIIGFTYLGTMFVEVLKFELLTRIFVPIHKWKWKKVKKRDSIRRSISDYLLRKPGRYFNYVKGDLEMRSIVLARFLLELEEDGLATHKRDGMRVRLLTLRKKRKKKKELRPYQRKILKALIKAPWQSPATIAEEVGRSKTFVERQLLRMERKDLVVARYEPEGPLYRAKIPEKKKRTYKRKKTPEGPPKPVPELEGDFELVSDEEEEMVMDEDEEEVLEPIPEKPMKKVKLVKKKRKKRVVKPSRIKRKKRRKIIKE
jgi:hypothetical protein